MSMCFLVDYGNSRTLVFGENVERVIRSTYGAQTFFSENQAPSSKRVLIVIGGVVRFATNDKIHITTMNVPY